MSRTLRLLPLLACLALLLVPSGAAAAKAKFPTVSKVTPLRAGVGDTLIIRGKNYRSGTRRNTVVFKRSGRRPVFVRAGRATSKQISVKLPKSLLRSLAQKKGKPVGTRFQVRISAKRFGKRYTTRKISPIIGPVPLAPKVTADDCDGDGLPNTRDSDDDNDLLPDTVEATIKTDRCKFDTDGDGLSDGWEQESALDYNGRAKPTPLKRPYPNALNAGDAAVDSDGDGMTNAQEYMAWVLFGGNKLPLSYSGGDPATGGKNRAPAGQEFADRDGNGFLSDNERDADGDGLPNQDEDLVDGFPSPVLPADPVTKRILVGAFSESRIVGAHNIVDFVPLYGPLPQTRKVLGLNWLDRDSDGDTVDDGSDDQDGDGLSNLAELKAELVATGDVEELQINPCAPNLDARLCIVGDDDIDKDGIPNRADDDDDGDRLIDVIERSVKLNPFKPDTDGDGVGDGFEYFSAKDLNQTNMPVPPGVNYPVTLPYPNPLDKADANIDHDGDGLSLLLEFRAWQYKGAPVPLSYSDGKQATDGVTLDGDRDVDEDNVDNYTEAVGPLSGPEWLQGFLADEKCSTSYVESPYPGPRYVGLDFTNPDSDGDGIRDGADDIDHDGLTNAEEGQVRVSNWCQIYVSTGPTPGTEHPGSNDDAGRYARLDPFNPCKPVNSPICHKVVPLGYYEKGEDWRGAQPSR